MSSTAPEAEEICLLTSNPYDAGQRALWHLEHIGQIIDCSFAISETLSDDLEIVYAVPTGQKKSNSAPQFPHSDSTEEIGFFGDALSPRVGETDLNRSPQTTPIIPPPMRYIRISEKTRVKFLNPNSVAIFSLDLSPSMNVIDTSFKSMTSGGCHLIEAILNCLETSLKCLLKKSRIIFQGSDYEFPFLPELFITIVAHGVPELGVVPLVVGWQLTADSIDQLLDRTASRLRNVFDSLSIWTQKNHIQEQLNGAISCSRTRIPCTSMVCQANDISLVVRDCLTAIAMTCSQLGLSKAGVNKSILIVTDGVLAHPRKLPYDNILMHLNFVDVAMHILQVGGGFAPWSALGYVSDPDLLRLLAGSTPTGLFIQDHHLDPILDGYLQPEGRGIFGPSPNISSNVLAKALLLKFSSLSTGIKRTSHMPFKSLTYQSSLLVNRKERTTMQNLSSYLDLIPGREHAIEIQGITDAVMDDDFELPQRALSSSLNSSPNMRRRVASMDSLASSHDTIEGGNDNDSTEGEEDNFSSVAIQSLKSYMQPEKIKARPYLYKQYKLPGVSAAQIIQTRVREGFLIETSSVRTPSPGGMSGSRRSSGLQRSGSVGLISSRTQSASSLHALSSPTTGPSPSTNESRRESTVSLSMNWGPTMDIIYEISTAVEDDESSATTGLMAVGSNTPGELFVSRSSEELRVKIYLRMLSGEFFLKFKQQLGVVGGDTYFGQMCKQLDQFIDAVFSIDDTLTKFTCPPKSRPSSVPGGLLGKRSGSDPRFPPPLMARQTSSESLGRGGNHNRRQSLDRIAEQSAPSPAIVIPVSESNESLASLESSFSSSPPLTPKLPATGPPAATTDSWLKDTIPRNVAIWHRWFTVRNIFVFIAIEPELAGRRFRHGMATQIFVSNREKLIQSIREFADFELEQGVKFVVKITARLNFSTTKSHVANILCRGNDVVINRLLGDARSGTVTDPIAPFVVIEIPPSCTGPSEPPHAVVKLNIGMFGLCPMMEREFVDLLSNRLCTHASLLDAPSPVFRTILAGGLMTTSSRQAKPTTQTGGVPPVGMGSGESFYTYKPDMTILNKFMLYYGWDAHCPPASVESDVLTHIHEERAKDGWKCIHETNHGLLYVKFTEREGAIRQSGPRSQIVPVACEMNKLWVPVSYKRTKPLPRSGGSAINSTEVRVDWAKRTDTDNMKKKTRNSIRAMCTCLHVQYIQQRGEKPLLRCQIWVDRGHPDWKLADGEDLASYARSLCHFEVN